MRSSVAAFLLYLAVALTLAFALAGVGLVRAPLLVNVILSSTALGIVAAIRLLQATGEPVK